MCVNEIKEIIKNRRIELGLTMADVAKAVGVSEATVSRWESGNIANMKRSRIAALAKVLKLSPSLIAGLEEPNETKTNSLDDLELEFPEGVQVLRRATKELTPAARAKMVKLMKAFLEEE